jgi:hypothetical protein
LAGVLSSIAAPAFARPNFTGVWKLDLAKSDLGPLANLTSLVRTITHDDPQLVIEVEVHRGSGRESGEMRFLTYGEETSNTVAGEQTLGHVIWLGDNLLMTTTRQLEGLRTRIVELWTLSPDAKTLRVDAAVTTEKGREDLLAIFSKE